MIIRKGLILTALLSCCISEKGTKHQNQEFDGGGVVKVKLAMENNRISSDWRKALNKRESKEYLDSLSQVSRPLTNEENEWLELIRSRTGQLAQIRDSIKVPFGDTYINDTTYILLGYQGEDDGFTYQYQTVCFDLTALYDNFSSAKDSVNPNRMDRLFAHEYTHLLSKEWARQNELKLRNYMDTILWLCLYEGLGMYRSMSARWFPVGDSLSEASRDAFETLYPIFTERLVTMRTSGELTKSEKSKLSKNLSHAPMNKKWGALPVGVWLAMEAEGDDRNLIKWVDMGQHAVIPLAKKYLPPDHREALEQAFLEYLE